MAKDKNLGKLKSRFEVRGGLVDEFGFHQNQGAMNQEEQNRFDRREEETVLREGEAAAEPQTEAERIEQLMADAHEKAQKNLRRREKREGKAAAAPARSKRGPTAKRSAAKAAKPAAGRGAARKGASQKGRGVPAKAASRKAAAKKRATKSGTQRGVKSAGKKVSVKAGSKKSGAKKSGGRSR